MWRITVTYLTPRVMTLPLTCLQMVQEKSAQKAKPTATHSTFRRLQNKSRDALAFCEEGHTSVQRSADVDIVDHFVGAARRASVRFLSSVVPKMPYRPMGAFFSEALAIIVAAELVGATYNHRERDS